MALFDDDDEDERQAVVDLASSVGSLEDWTCTAEARSACLTMVAEMEAAAVMVEKILILFLFVWIWIFWIRIALMHCGKDSNATAQTNEWNIVNS